MRLLECHVLKHSQSVLIRNQTYRQNEIFKSRLKRKEEENGTSLSGIRTRVLRSPSRQMISKNSKVVWPVGRAPRPSGGRSCSCGRSTWGCIPRPELTMTSLSVFVKSIRIILFCFYFYFTLAGGCSGRCSSCRWRPVVWSRLWRSPPWGSWRRDESRLSGFRSRHLRDCRFWSAGSRFRFLKSEFFLEKKKIKI